MKKYFEILQKCPLFEGLSVENITAILNCLGATNQKYEKNHIIFAEGEPAKYLGIVLSGTVQIVRMDYYGNRTILTNIEPSQIFGEAFACTGIDALPVDVIAADDTEALLIDVLNITQSCNNACSFHSRLIFNLLNVVARKNILFHQKIEITSKRSTREKLMTYLHIQAKKYGSNSFIVPYDRQELADYLGVERSGLSAEISKLRNEGVIECRKNQFTFIKN